MTTLDEKSIAFLEIECNGLYNQAQSSAQTVFNFYLTFVSAVIAAIVLVVQSGASVGTVYLSALSGRYARYAYTVDSIRRYLVATMQLRVPPVYWFVPTGTYQVFMALVILNAFSRWVIVRLGRGQIVDIWNDSPAWAGKEA